MASTMGITNKNEADAFLRFENVTPNKPLKTELRQSGTRFSAALVCYKIII
jgi:hypothetical protein